MSLDQAAVARIATLARIKLDEEQQAAMAKELSGILDWIAQLDEVDTRDTEPMRSVMDIRTSGRADTVTGRMTCCPTPPAGTAPISWSRRWSSDD